MGILLNSGDKVVFFGDSITQADPGYVSFITEMLDSLYPELQVEIVNKGVGGNSINQLMERVHRDVVELNPQIVSIAIGINDAWPGHSNGVPPDRFEERYRELIEILKSETKARIILCTPSINGEDPQSESNRILEPYVDAVNRLGSEFNLLVVPIRDAFISGLKRARPTTNKPLFTTDGVHLNQAGNTLYGTTWLKTVGAFQDLLG